MDLEAFRKEKDAFFRSEESPLTPVQRAAFLGLRYYPENPQLRLALPLEVIEGSGFVMLDTSTGAKRRYRRAGKVRFTVAGREAVLTVFADEDGEFFLPFRDATSGKETYGAGRYLEPEMEDGKLDVDFNLAYNPYCAYSESYSCPLPPRENWLSVPIEAGEKRYHDQPPRTPSRPGSESGAGTSS